MRIAIVNDVKVVVESLKNVLYDAGHRLAWVAHNGVDAVAKCAEDPPDLILMDLVMPLMNGVEATRLIMKQYPCPILIVTSSVEGHSTLVFEAMGAGALDVIRTPESRKAGNLFEIQALLKKIQVIGCLIQNNTSPKSLPATLDARSLNDENTLPPLLVIGASTGGPMAIVKVLSAISAKASLAIMLVQHVDSDFAEGLASWLSEQISFPVKVAEEGDIPKKGVVLLAGKEKHMLLTKALRIRYAECVGSSPYCPSVDVFYESLAENWPAPGIAVLLTGMGNDGAAGLKLLYDKGWFTVAEHQSSCVVYGMPKAAVDLGAATEVIPLERIGETIVHALTVLKHDK